MNSVLYNSQADTTGKLIKLYLSGHLKQKGYNIIFDSLACPVNL